MDLKWLGAPRGARPAVVALCLAALATGTAACTADSPAASSGGNGPAAGANGQPVGSASDHAPVPSEPSFHDNPEPTAVATDAPVSAAPTGEASVSITYASWDAGSRAVEVGGYVADVVESGGTCTVVLTRGDHRATATSSAEADASTTSCGAVSVPGGQLSSGTWEAVLSYGSADHRGASAPTEVVVP